MGDQAAIAIGRELASPPTPTQVINLRRFITSIKILADHAMLLDKLGLARLPWTMMEIHGGKSDRAQRLIKVTGNLPEEIRSRLALENDEYAYSSEEILAICRQTGVPMVFDAHHHVIHEALECALD